MAGRLDIFTLTRQNQNEKLYDLPFLLVLIFLFFDYGRPQSLIPALAILHIPMFIQILLGLTLLFKNKLFNIQNIQTKYFITLVALMAFHVPFAVNNFWAFQVTRTMTLYLIVYLSIIGFVNSYPKMIKFIELWIIIFTVCAFIGIIQGGRIIGSGFMGDENDFALVMNIAIPFAYFMFLETESFRKKLFYFFSIILFIAANVSSFSRGGFVGLVPVIAYCWYKTPKKIFATVVIVLILGILSSFATEKYWGEIRSITEQNTTTGTGASRWYTWKCAWAMFLDHRIMGVGPGNFNWNFQLYEPPDGFKGRLHGGRAAHSVYFTLIPEFGLIGIFLFSAMLYSMRKDKKWILKLEKKFRRSLPSEYIKQSPHQGSLAGELNKIKFIIFGINGALLGYLVSGIFLSVLYYPHFWFLIAISVALKNVVKNKAEELQPPEIARL